MNFDSTVSPRTFMTLDSFIATLLLHLLGLALPLTVLQLYDSVIPNQSIPTLVFLAIGIAVTIILDFILRINRSNLTSWRNITKEYSIVKKLLTKLTSESIAKEDSAHNQDNANLVYFLGNIQEYLNKDKSIIFLDAIFILLYFSIIFAINQKLLLIMCAPTVLFAVLTAFLLHSAPLMRNSTKQWNYRCQDFLRETLASNHIIKSLAVENAMMRRYERLQTNCARAFYDQHMLQAHLRNLGKTFSISSVLLIALYGAYLVITADLSPGELSACMLLSSRATEPLQHCLISYSENQKTKAARVAIDDLVSAKPTNVTGVSKASGTFDYLDLNHVSFTYHDSMVSIFRNMNASLLGGEMIYVSSPSGAGKTTLALMLAGILTPDQGRITLYQRRPITHQSVDFTIARIIPQRATLFNGTIMDNITGFRPEKCDTALFYGNKTRIDMDLIDLPYGYNTEIRTIKDNRITRQLAKRICLLRAFMGVYPILIIDDYDDALSDSERETYLKCLREHAPNSVIVFLGVGEIPISLFQRHFRIKNQTIIEN